MSQTYRFDILCPPDPAAGFIGMTDTVVVTVESGDPGGDELDFIGDLTDFLSEWYYVWGGRVTYMGEAEDEA